MTTKKTFGIVVVAGCLVPAVALCVVNGFVPAIRDVADPLGRPSQLSADVIGSAHQFDQITARLEPDHADLAHGIQAIFPLADDLEILSNQADGLPERAAGLTTSTTTVIDVAHPLPDLVTAINGRVQQTNPKVGELSTAVGALTEQLVGIRSGLETTRSTLAGIGPKTTQIASVLATIEAESAQVQVFGPVLGAIGPPVNQLNIPPLGFTAPPLPPLPHP